MKNFLSRQSLHKALPQALHAVLRRAVARTIAQTMMSAAVALAGTLFASSLATAPALAQLSPFSVGVGGLGAMTVSEFTNRPIEIGFRPYLMYQFSESFAGELGAGFVSASGKNPAGTAEFRTALITPDLRLRFMPFSGNWRPYLFAGVGLTSYNITTRPDVRGVTIDGNNSGLGLAIPGGIGIHGKLTDNLGLDAHVGMNGVLTDNINPIQDNASDPHWMALVGLTWRFGNADSDGDGLSDALEAKLGTNPNSADSDGDGLRDGDEVNLHKTDPAKADTDGDGLSDGDELNKYKTSPMKADSDGDGLSDGDEVNKYGCDPLKTDTDGDTLSDGDEVNTHKTNPAKADTDGDTLPDNEEIAKYKTDALKADTDGDGLADNMELMTSKTDPLKADTDGDGLSDGDEVNKHKTDPLVVDTDKGTVPDGEEVKQRKNPLDPKDDVAPAVKALAETKLEVGKALVLEGIEFETGKATITPASESVLQGAYRYFTEYSDISVEIDGHTDNVGNKAKNIKLSQARADAVKDWLIAKGIAKDRITARGFGPDKPAVPNTTPENKKKNRRIEFVRTK
jgi:outer membrane protein OmpA-like peptidoglycan-associated protein